MLSDDFLNENNNKTVLKNIINCKEMLTSHSISYYTFFNNTLMNLNEQKVEIS